MPPRKRTSAKPPALRSVGKDETSPAPPPEPPKSVLEAANAGTRRELLVAMRTRIALAVQDLNTPPRDLAALTKRLGEVSRDIEAIDAREKQDGARGGPTADEAWTAI